VRERVRDLTGRPLFRSMALSVALHILALSLFQYHNLLAPRREVILRVTLVPVEAPKVHKERARKPKAQKKRKQVTRKPPPKRKEAPALAAKRRPKKEDPERRRLAAIKEIERRVRERGQVPPGTLDLYLSLLRQRVRAFWAIPDVLLKEGLKAVVRVKISGDGRILSVQIEESSGDPNFDRSTIQALLKAEPLPPPPGGQTVEVGLVFRP